MTDNSQNAAPETPSLKQLTQALIAFRDARDWKQFHTVKDLILSLNLEAAELLELTQWQSEVAFEESLENPDVLQKISEECADVLLYLLLIANQAGIDLQQAAADKMKKNAAKYPVEKSRGLATKYTRL